MIVIMVLVSNMITQKFVKVNAKIPRKQILEVFHTQEKRLQFRVLDS